MNPFGDYSQFRNELLSHTRSAEQEVRRTLESIEEKQSLNAYLEVYADEAVNRAAAIDAEISKNQIRPLSGCIVAVKDNICIRNHRVTCGSKILENFSSLYSATVIERLEEAGAIVIGKTNLDEFAMGSSTEHSAFGVVHHPLDPDRIPGGSSGGSAVAVAAGMAHIALGSDTGGSIRQPASLCGIYGLKPTYGRVSRYGLVAFGSSFDCIGPFARSINDIALSTSIMAGHDPKDSTSSRQEVNGYSDRIEQSVKGLRIGVPREYFSDALDPEIHAAVTSSMEILKQQGATFVDVSLPHAEFTIAVYYILSTAEASSNLARYDGARYGFRSQPIEDLSEMYTSSRSQGFGDEVKRRIMLGTYVLSSGYYDAYYNKAQQVRRLIKQDFDTAFGHVDALIAPTTPGTAFKIGEKANDPLQMYLSDIFTVSANLAGVPAISVPFGIDHQGLPISVQIFGPQFGESTIFQIANSLEQNSPI